MFINLNILCEECMADLHLEVLLVLLITLDPVSAVKILAKFDNLNPWEHKYQMAFTCI